MNYRTIIFVAFVNVLGLVAVGDGSGILGLGLLSPLLPVATITGNAGLLAHGLTGAALLNLKAAGLLSGLFLLSGRGIELNLGNNEANGWGWSPPSSGWGSQSSQSSEGWGSQSSQSSGGWGSQSSGGWDSRRKKRSTDEVASEVVDNYGPSLDQVLEFDQLGCGMRLVCELSATPYVNLMEDERLMLELFGRDGKIPAPSKSSKGKLSYSYASLLGSNAKDGVKACERIYAGCPYSRVQIMGQLRQTQF